jgi:hypothetical protein
MKTCRAIGVASRVLNIVPAWKSVVRITAGDNFNRKDRTPSVHYAEGWVSRPERGKVVVPVLN